MRRYFILVAALAIAAAVCLGANYHLVSSPVLQDYAPVAPDSIYAVIYDAAGDSIAKINFTASDSLRTGVFEKVWTNSTRGPITIMWNAWVGTKHLRDIVQIDRMDDSVPTMPSNFYLTAINGAGAVKPDFDVAYGDLAAAKFEAGCLNGKGDWTTDADVSQLIADLATAHGAGSWVTPTGYLTAAEFYVYAILSGYFPGCRSHTHYATDADTTFAYLGVTYKGRIIAHHVGGAPGDFPDSANVDTIGGSW